MFPKTLPFVWVCGRAPLGVDGERLRPVSPSMALRSQSEEGVCEAAWSSSACFLYFTPEERLSCVCCVTWSDSVVATETVGDVDLRALHKQPAASPERGWTLMLSNPLCLKEGWVPIPCDWLRNPTGRAVSKALCQPKGRARSVSELQTPLFRHKSSWGSQLEIRAQVILAGSRSADSSC